MSIIEPATKCESFQNLLSELRQRAECDKTVLKEYNSLLHMNGQLCNSERLETVAVEFQKFSHGYSTALNLLSEVRSERGGSDSVSPWEMSSEDFDLTDRPNLCGAQPRLQAFSSVAGECFFYSVSSFISLRVTLLMLMYQSHFPPSRLRNISEFNIHSEMLRVSGLEGNF